MTVVVAVKCPAGVVLATDSQATSQMLGGIPMKLPTKKIARLGSHLVFGSTGGQGATQRVHLALNTAAAAVNSSVAAAETADLLRATVNPIQKMLRSEWVELPNTQPEMWGAIFCGWGPEGPWIYEIDVGGAAQFHETFAATGSGHAVAHAALTNVAHFDVAHQSLEGAKAIAYRAIESTCQSSAWGVGLPVQIAVVTENGVDEIVAGDETHTELMEFVDLWKAKEVETLGRLAPAAQPPEAEDDAPSIDAPSATADIRN